MEDVITKKENPLTSYLRHAVVVVLMKFSGDALPSEGMPEAAQWIAEAVVLAAYWAAVKYGHAAIRNKILPWLDRVSGHANETKTNNDPR